MLRQFAPLSDISQGSVATHLSLEVWWATPQVCYTTLSNVTQWGELSQRFIDDAIV